jgi:hypothetical protein
LEIDSVDFGTEKRDREGNYGHLQAERRVICVVQRQADGRIRADHIDIKQLN